MGSEEDTFSRRPLKALETALSQLDRDSSSLIHHSDRGVQYASLKYTRILKENGVAERVNGIIKNEIIGGQNIGSFPEALKKVADAVNFYNRERPYLSCGMLTPDEAANCPSLLHKKWKSAREDYLKSLVSTDA